MAFKGLRFAAAEIWHASAGTVMKVVMVAISVIPLLYGGLYLTAFLDPYENLDTVPVAVVNEDAGAEVDGEWRVVGDDVVEKLADNHDGLGWEFVSADEAENGLETGKYYMTCTIPENFTETIASADSDAPEKAALVIDYNQTQNMLANQIGGTVWKEVRTQVSDTVAEEYWSTVFDRLNDGGDQIQEAADGADELHDGLTDARKGSGTITTNLGSLADGADSLVSGLGQLVAGSFSLADGTNTLAVGANSLKSGSDTLTSGARSLSSGASALKNQGTSALASGASKLEEKTQSLPDAKKVAEAKSGSTSISSGISGLQSASSQLATGSASLVGGIRQLNSGLGTAQGGAAQLADGLSGAPSQCEALAAGLSGASDNLNNIAAALKAGQMTAADAAANLSSISNALSSTATSVTAMKGDLQTAYNTASALSSGLEGAVTTTGAGGELLSGAQSLQAGIGNASDTSAATLNGGLNQLSAGYSSFNSQIMPLVEKSPELREAIVALDAGASTVNSKMGEVATGAGKVSDGASQISDGTSQLQSGTSQLYDGAIQLANGTTTAKDGSERIANGAVQLRDGSQELTDGLATAEDGAGELADGLADGAEELHVDGSEAKAEVMSAPVELDEEYFTTVKNYGTGFAPYFISLGLWVGALMAGFVLRPLNRRLVLSGGNPLMAAFSSFMPLALMSVVQALLLLVVLQFGLQLQIDNVPGYYAFGILTGLVFAAFMQFLMAAFGFPGKFIAIILLMLQLTSAAGTFPIEQTPAFFQAMNPFMPMTYVVAGMRQIMTGVDYNTVALCVAVLAGLGIVSFGLTALVARSKRMVRMEDLHPILQLG